jgi:hypothetical protein
VPAPRRQATLALPEQLTARLLTPLIHSTRVNRTRQRATRSPALRRDRRPPPRAAATALALRRPADALDLQHRAGNQAVVRTLARQETGLKLAKPTNAYAKDAATWAQKTANGGKTLAQFATHLVEEANKALGKLGCPAMKIDFAYPGPGHAAFERGEWRIGIHTEAFSRRAGIYTVADLNVSEAETIVESIWHEARHAEQYFRIAQMRAAKSAKTKPEDVAAELTGVKYEKGAAEAAAKAPLKAAKGNEQLLAEAAEWEAITLGAHQQYKENVTDWMDEATNALVLAHNATADSAGEVKARLGAFLGSWMTHDTRELFLDPYIKATEKIATKSALDERVITHLKAIKAQFDALKAAWKTVVDGWDKLKDDERLTRVRGVEGPLRALWTALFTAYQAHPHEADARAAGKAAGAEFRKRLKK